MTSKRRCRHRLAVPAAGLLVACASAAPAPTLVLAGSKSTTQQAEPLHAMPVTPASEGTTRRDFNPFVDAQFYLNPEYQSRLDATMAAVISKPAAIPRIDININPFAEGKTYGVVITS